MTRTRVILAAGGVGLASALLIAIVLASSPKAAHSTPWPDDLPDAANALVERALASDDPWISVDESFGTSEWFPTVRSISLVADENPLTQIDMITRGVWPRARDDGGEIIMKRLRDQGLFLRLCEFSKRDVAALAWQGDGPMLQVGVEGPGSARLIARIAVAELRLALSEGRVSDFLCTLEGTLLLATAVANRHGGSDFLSAVAMHDEILGETRRLIVEHALSAESLDRIEEIVSNRCFVGNVRLYLNIERLDALAHLGPSPDSVQWNETDRRFADTVLRLEAMPTALSNTRFAISDDVLEVVESAVPRSRTILSVVAGHDLTVAATLIVIDLERFRQRSGTLPRSLDDLDGSARRDRAQFKYRVLEDGETYELIAWSTDEVFSPVRPGL